MNEMIDRIADIVAEHRQNWEYRTDREVAVMILEAMRKPTAEMVGAADDPAWVAMFDTLLADHDDA